MDLSNINNPNITTMDHYEAIAYIKQIRLSRRTVKKRQSVATRKKKAKEKEIPKVSKNDALRVLKLLRELGEI